MGVGVAENEGAGTGVVVGGSVGVGEGTDVEVSVATGEAVGDDVPVAVGFGNAVEVAVGLGGSVAVGLGAWVGVKVDSWTGTGAAVDVSLTGGPGVPRAQATATINKIKQDADFLTMLITCIDMIFYGTYFSKKYIVHESLRQVNVAGDF